MNNIFEQLITRVKRLALPPEDKAAIRDSLLAYMRAHPVSRLTSSSLGRKANEDIRSSPSLDEVRVGDPTRHHPRAEGLKNNNKLPMSIIVIIALLLSGGVSYAAEGSVPGEALYVIKTEVNEPLKGALAVSEKAQANLEARLATERLEEAEVLAARGTLHAEVSTTLSERFAAHAERVGERIEALEEKDAAAAVELSSEFEA